MVAFCSHCCTGVYSGDAVSHSRCHFRKIFRRDSIEKMKFSLLQKSTGSTTLLRSIKCKCNCNNTNNPKKAPFEYIDYQALLRKAIVDANRVCTSDIYVDEFECMAAWDTVDEIVRGIATRNARDPLEDYCAENQDADECRVYDI